LPLVLGVYWQKVLLSVGVFALLAISWDILAQSGMVSLGQALFFGVGAYCSGVMNQYWGLSPLISIPAASILGGLICTLMLLPVLRLRGIYFSMVTLIVPLVLVRIIEATRIFGGTEGLSGMTPLPSKWVELYLAMAVLLTALFGFRRMMDSDYGLVLKAINDNDRSVINAGINIYWFKTQALFIAGAIGLLRGVHDPCVHVRGHAGLCLDYSILPIAAAVVGGPGTLAGATLGACILVPMSEALRGFGGLRIVLYGLFWWSSSWPCPRAFFIISSANTTSSSAGWRWKNDRCADSHRHRPEQEFRGGQGLERGQLRRSCRENCWG
jgi:branched-chain amino acid transport system permease protein